MEPYIVYGGDLSLFTRKLDAALRFYGTPFEIRPKTPDLAAEIQSRSGTHQVPVLLTPENWMLGDTTPLLEMLDARFPARRMFPEGELGVLVHVIEEFLDEWVARVMVHYRWHYPDSAKTASTMMAAGNPAVAERMLSWGPRACRATGTESEVQQRAAEDEYLRLMAALEEQLQHTRYALGDRPTAVDCMLLGGLRAHTNRDPDPKKAIAGFTRVLAWSDTLADQWDGSGELAPFPASTPFAQHVLNEMPTTWARFAQANRDALAAGAKACRAEIYGEAVSFLTRPYPEQSRQMLQRHIQNKLQAPQQAAVMSWLGENGLAEAVA